MSGPIDEAVQQLLVAPNTKKSVGEKTPEQNKGQDNALEARIKRDLMPSEPVEAFVLLAVHPRQQSDPVQSRVGGVATSAQMRVRFLPSRRVFLGVRGFALPSAQSQIAEKRRRELLKDCAG